MEVWGEVPQLPKTLGDLGQSPQPLSNFCFHHFEAIWIKFHTFLKPFERTELLRFETKLKNYIAQALQALSSFTGQIQNMFKRSGVAKGGDTRGGMLWCHPL